nr:Putative tick transposon [Haemonchus contortus]
MHCSTAVRAKSVKVPWDWNETHEEAFGELKAKLTSTPVLSQLDVEAARTGECPYIIHTEASQLGIGAVLSQEGKDHFLHPIYFASNRLSSAEKRYHVTDLEALTIVFALQKFHYFVYGMEVVVRTDHLPLTALFKRSNVSSRVVRWASEIQQYKLTIEYVKGKANAVADALSRGIPLDERALAMRHPGDKKIVYVMNEDRNSEWLSELGDDVDYGKVLTLLGENKRRRSVILPGYGKKLRVADFVLEQGDLKLIREDGKTVYVVVEK